MNLPPGLFGRRLVVQAGVIWFLVRLGVGTLALTAGEPESLALAPRASVLLVGLVSAITWIDLRRRNLLVLLPKSDPSASWRTWSSGVWRERRTSFRRRPTGGPMLSFGASFVEASRQRVPA